MSAKPMKSTPNEQVWGLRPVRWGLRMFGDEGGSVAEHLAQDFASRELREVTDFLGLKLPSGEKKNLAKRLLEAAETRRQLLGNESDEGSVLYGNLDHLRLAFNLSEVELDVLAIRTVIRLHPGFETLVDTFINRCTDFVFHRKLACVLDTSEDSVRAALARSSALVHKGLISVKRGDKLGLDERIELLPGMTHALIAPADSANDLFARVSPPQREAALPLSAYPHLSREVALIRDRLALVIKQHAKGVNVLLHGSPGTGKSELAASLAKSLDRPLYAVATAWQHRASYTPRERMCAIGQLQRLVDVTGFGLVLVDEAEDLFPTVWSDAEKTPTKAAVNECLETNPTPTIWISNRTEHMDEAFLRRFDLVIHVPALPSSSRHKLLEESLPKGTLEEAELRRYAEKRELSPAMITRLAKVVSSGRQNDPQAIRGNLCLLSNHYLRTLGASPLPERGTAAQLEHDLALLNTQPPLAESVDAMTHANLGARMLLHGAPGTGKTAFGKAIAERLDKPLFHRQASSLLSMWVGGTEKNIRGMFDEARLEGGVLLLDEADSFLRNRDRARVSWEVTQTNELLTQMESFEGIFICTTNRLDDLDPAALRRFDFKVEFRPLRIDQRIRLIRQCCTALGIDSGDEATWASRARQLDGLTPGDAAASLRRLRLSSGAPRLETLLDTLANECRYKPAAHAPIGFVR